ncbi:hypothetical protein [Glycomyces sp. NPDC047010]|uniref:hypothetical protein n=1 Tax=Glycomyces sp. NPDC047010 TaxID=3155023 RepID=UPI00340C680F
MSAAWRRYSAVLTGALLVTVGCTPSGAEDGEAPEGTVLSDVCGDLDYGAAAALLGDEAVQAVSGSGEVLGSTEVGTLLCGAEVPPPANTEFGFAVWNYIPDNGNEEFIAGREQIWGDLGYVYPLQGADYGEIDRSLLVEPEVEELSADGWDRAAVVRYFQVGEDAQSWDPDGDGMVVFCSFQTGDLTIDFELRVGDQGTGTAPDTQPYTEMLTGVADQLAERLDV